MTKEEAIADSIKHWETMIEWVKTQPQDDYIDHLGMILCINMCWGGKYCSLCKEYLGNIFHPCPLSNQICSGQCANEWQSVSLSITWHSWIINAEKLLAKLKALL